MCGREDAVDFHRHYDDRPVCADVDDLRHRRNGRFQRLAIGPTVMKLFMRKVWSDQRGGAMVEFALLAPLFLVMFIGVLQAGMALQAYNSVRRVSSETVRDVSVQYQ